jgi:hypothetical protein
MFHPIRIKKFDGDSNPKKWIRNSPIAVRVANDTSNMMDVYFLVMMSEQAQSWLEKLCLESINIWQDLCAIFIKHFQASCLGFKTRWDLGSITEQPNDPLCDYNKRCCANHNTIAVVDGRDVIHYFQPRLAQNRAMVLDV